MLNNKQQHTPIGAHCTLLRLALDCRVPYREFVPTASHRRLHAVSSTHCVDLARVH